MPTRPPTDDNHDMEPVRPPKWIVPAVGVAVVVVIAIAAVLNAGRRVPTLDPSTPEGVAQGFVLAVFDDDEATALDYLTDELADRCDDEVRFWFPEPGRVVIVDTTVNDERATVELRISTTSADSPFELSDYTRDMTLVMTRYESGWRISEEPSRWFSCPPGDTP